MFAKSSADFRMMMHPPFTPSARARKAYGAQPLLLTALLLLPALSSSQAENRLGVLDSIVESSIEKHEIPGAVLLVGHDGQVTYRKAFGSRALEPSRSAMTVDTIFDIASLTKVVATTTAIMQLEERGKVRLNDPVVK